MKTQDIMAKLQAKYPLEKEYLQAVQEVLESIEEVYNRHPAFEKAKIVESSLSVLLGSTTRVKSRRTSVTVSSSTAPSAPTRAVCASTRR